MSEYSMTVYSIDYDLMLHIDAGNFFSARSGN